MSYQRLIDDHDEIDRLCGEVLELAQASPNVGGALDLLWDLSVAVTDHLAFEDRKVYARLIRKGSANLPSAVSDFEIAFCELRADWQTYLSDWQADTLACDWPNFAEETVAMMRRLRQRVRDESNLIYPLALQQSLIRLRVDGVAKQSLAVTRPNLSTSSSNTLRASC